MSLIQISNATLRRAIREHAVSFPAQIPVFLKQSRSDIQWRVAQLYFTGGWSEAAIADRFGVSRRRIDEILDGWKMRAVALGYIQEIAPEKLHPTPREPAASSATSEWSPLHFDFLPHQSDDSQQGAIRTAAS